MICLFCSNLRRKNFPSMQNKWASVPSYLDATSWAPNIAHSDTYWSVLLSWLDDQAWALDKPWREPSICLGPTELQLWQNTAKWVICFFLKKKKSSSHFWRLESRRSRGLHLTRKHSQDDSIRSFRREELSWQIIRKTPPLNTATVRFKLSRYKLRGHIPIIYTVWIVGILTDLWTVPDFFPDFTNMERGFYLKKEKKKEKKKTMILLPASEMHQLFLRIPRHSTSFISSWASVLITFLRFMKPHSGSVSLCYTGFWETFILSPPHCYSWDFQRGHHLWVPKWVLSLIQGSKAKSHYPSPREKTDLFPIQWVKRIGIVCLS